MKNKKIIFGILAVIIILIIVLFINVKNKDIIKNENIAWDKLVLGNKLPEPVKPYGNVGVDLETSLMVALPNYSKENYIKYKEECIKRNYTIEKNESNDSYIAFNDEGYKIRLVYSSDVFNIFLDAPEKMANIEWPLTGLVTLIPVPNSSNGRIYSNNDTSFVVHLSNMSKDDLKNYKEKCKEVGFNNNISEDDKYYNASDKNGNKLKLLYLGFNNIEIVLSSEKSSNNNDKKEETDGKEPDNSSKQPEDELSKNNNGSESVSYSTNDKANVTNGNTGIYSYRSRGGEYYNYYIVDFDNGYVYYFSEGNGSEICDKAKITSGDLNSTLIITLHDGNNIWEEKLFFKYKNQPNHLIVNHNSIEYDFYPTNLNEALKIRDKKEIKNK